MRFGKTFASYQLAKKMGFKRVLILTFKPAVQTAWREDLMTHMDFEGWQFITRPTVPGGLSTDAQYQRADKNRPIVCFGSFQDFLGVNKETGGIKANNEWVHSAMRQVNAAEILDIAMAGTSATLLAKRWESALLVNVDNDTLARLLASEEAMDALMRIEGFRSLNADIETIINKSNAVKKAKKENRSWPVNLMSCRKIISLIRSLRRRFIIW